MGNKTHPDEIRARADQPSDGEQLTICKSCGQIFDGRDERQARHHAKDKHRPLLAPWADDGG